MTDLEAIMVIESGDHREEEDTVIEAWQTLIDSGTVWQLQGFYARTAYSLIAAGICSSENK